VDLKIEEIHYFSMNIAGYRVIRFEQRSGFLPSALESGRTQGLLMSERRRMLWLKALYS
jgi:hypothetical protein